MSQRTRKGRESSSGGRTAGGGFGAGTKVEVSSDEEGFRGAWYEATVVRCLPRRGYSVEYVSLVSDTDPSEPLHEIVLRSHVRPQPPPPPPSFTRYQIFQRVEVFHNDGWWAGVVSKLPREDSGRLTVSFPNTREFSDFPPSEIRPLLEWIRGQWIVEEVAEPLFSVGAQVEVGQERENYGAAWFAATIGIVISKSIFLVDYKTLRAVTDRELSTEIVDAQYIRPAPPIASEDENFGLHDVVEVLYHGGWSLGVVSQIPNGSKYIVKLKDLEEEMEFNHSEIRSCQLWEDGQWISHSSQDRNRKSPMLGGARSTGRRRKSRAGKRSSLPISVSTSSDDDATCVRLSGVLHLKRKKIEGSDTRVRMSSSHPYRKLNQGKLFDYKLHPQDRFSSKTPLGVEAESQVAKPLLEDSLSSLDVQHRIESTSPEEFPTKLLQNPSSVELNYGQNMTRMNGVTKSFNGRNEPSDFMFKGSEHQSKASGFNHSPVNDEASDFLPITAWGSCKGSHGPREGSMKRMKKLAIRVPHRQKKSSEVVSMKQFSQEEIKTRKRGRPAKRSRDSEQAKDLPEEVAEEEHGRQEVEQSNQGQSGDASVETRALGHHDEATGHKEPPLLVNMQDSPTSNAVCICQNDQQKDVLEDTQTMPQIELLTRVDTSIKVSTTQQSSFMLARSFLTRLDEVLTFDSQHNKAATGAEEGALVSVSKKDNAASCEGLNPSGSPSKRTSDENKEALINPSSCCSSLKEVILPFLKSSSMWESIEAMDIFHTMPQQPHFRPLEQYSMEFREGMAIGLMVSFANMAANIHKLNIADNRSIFEERLKALGPLESNGFDVGRLRACLEELLETQSNQRQSESKKAELERKIVVRKGDNDRLDALAVQLDKAIMEVEQNLARFRESRELVIMQRKINETEISKLQKDVQEAEEAYHSAEHHFNTTVFAPW